MTDSAGAIEGEVNGAGPGSDKGLDLTPLPGLIGYALRRAQIAFFQRFRQIFGDLDLTPSQLGVLTVVANNPGLKQSEVSAALGIKRANLVPLLDALAARDLVARNRPAADRRSHALHLTEAGARLLAEAQAREADHERAVAALLGPGGRDSLIELLGRVETACRAGEVEDGA